MIRRLCLVASYFISLPVFSTSLGIYEPIAAAPTRRHVLLIGIDGLSGLGLEEVGSPVLTQLMEEGAYTLQGKNMVPTVSSPNWRSMITGVTPFQHRVWSNHMPGIWFGNWSIPTIFARLHREKPKAKIAMIYEWKNFSQLVELGVANWRENHPTAEATTQRACELIRTQKPTLTFVHLDHVDHAGHGYGHGTPQYREAILLADTLIGEMLNALEQAGILEETLVLVTADHGHYGAGHGGDTYPERSIPVILWGKGVAKTELQHQVRTIDIAPTIALALGLSDDGQMMGRPMVNGFVEYARRPQSPTHTLQVKPQSAFSRVYTDRHSGAHKDLSIWRPLPIEGFRSLGDVAKEGYEPPTSPAWLVENTDPLTSKPIGYEQISSSFTFQALQALTLWHPICPLGFIGLSDVAMSSYGEEPSRDLIRCVRESIAAPGEAKLLWNSTSSKSLPERGIFESVTSNPDLLSVHGFVTRGNLLQAGTSSDFVVLQKAWIHEEGEK